jgi:hypothetical protein
MRVGTVAQREKRHTTDIRVTPKHFVDYWRTDLSVKHGVFTGKTSG